MPSSVTVPHREMDALLTARAVVCYAALVTAEVPRQIDLFTGELIDTRRLWQKNRNDRHAQQIEMFSQRELAQFGVRARPRLPITPMTRLELAGEDPRTDEERERDAQREAEQQTPPMFDKKSELTPRAVVCYASAILPVVPRGHELLPQEIREKLPPLYSTDALGLEAQAVVKFFTPDSNWTWYASEGSPVDEDGFMDTDKEKVDFIFFGLVSGHFVELGYFALSELEDAHGPLGLPIERDLSFEQKTLRELQGFHEREHTG